MSGYLSHLTAIKLQVFTTWLYLWH